MRQNNESLSNICKTLALNKTTVYYHIRKNFGRSYSLVDVDYSNLDKIGEIIGVFAGDGSAVRKFNHVWFHFGYDEKEYAESFSEVLYSVFNKKPYMYPYKRTINLRYNSKRVYNFILEYLEWFGNRTASIRLVNLTLPSEFIIGFLRGFWDAEGYTDRDRIRTTVTTISPELAVQVNSMLIGLGFKSHCKEYYRKNRAPHTRIYLKNNEALRFLSVVCPRNNKRLSNKMGSPRFELGLPAI